MQSAYQQIEGKRPHKVGQFPIWPAVWMPAEPDAVGGTVELSAGRRVAVADRAVGPA